MSPFTWSCLEPARTGGCTGVRWPFDIGLSTSLITSRVIGEPECIALGEFEEPLRSADCPLTRATADTSTVGLAGIGPWGGGPDGGIAEALGSLPFARAD